MNLKTHSNEGPHFQHIRMNSGDAEASCLTYVYSLDHISQTTSPIDVKLVSYKTRLVMRFTGTENELKQVHMNEILIFKYGGQISHLIADLFLL